MRTSARGTVGARHRLVSLLIAVLLVGGACGGSDGAVTREAGSDAESASPAASGSDDEAASGSDDEAASGSDDEAASGSDDEAASGSDDDAAPARNSSGSSIAELITELPPAPTGLPAPAVAVRQPTGLSIAALGVEVATVIDVGVEDNGDMEIPPADQVGWYRYGPTPGAAGSSVLAAHIAYDGENGVFVDLIDLELGSLITVAYDDGTTEGFVAVSKEQYDKSELPKDEVWGRDGDPRLVLITCGGDFNRQVSSYEDNVVVYANPVGPAES